MPDVYLPSPGSDFVLCRNKDGIATAVYGEDEWDFNPYRLSARKITKIQFLLMVGGVGEEVGRHLIGEVKWILYQIIYHSGSGRAGKTSASTLYQYYVKLSQMVEFCIKQNKNEFTSGMSLFELLGNVTYLAEFVRASKSEATSKKMVSSLLGILRRIDVDDLGFSPVDRKYLNLKRGLDQQTPVIPARIYLAIMQRYTLQLEAIYPYAENIKGLIIEMEDRAYGAAISTQLSQFSIPDDRLRPTMLEAIKLHGLSEIVGNVLPEIPTRAAFQGWIRKIQYIAKTVIHFYSGLRDQEFARLQYDCISQRELDRPMIDSSGSAIDAGRMVSLISTTTKFTGYKMEESWLAPDVVCQAVSVCRVITEGLSYLYGVDPKNSPLLLSPYIIRSMNAQFCTTSFSNTGHKGIFEDTAIADFFITSEDLIELSETDENRDFKGDAKFTVGKIWPLASHQFRRSLAFYARNSGFVSLPSVTWQFKHTAREMSQYYARNSNIFLPIFTGNDLKNVPNKRAPANYSHIGFEYQAAYPVTTVKKLFEDIFESDSTLMGGTGSFIEKQKSKIVSGEIDIRAAKDETLLLAKKGEFDYRATLLGGCTKVGPCDDYLLGEITACLTCPGAIIKDTKVDELNPPGFIGGFLV